MTSLPRMARGIGLVLGTVLLLLLWPGIGRTIDSRSVVDVLAAGDDAVVSAAVVTLGDGRRARGDRLIVAFKRQVGRAQRDDAHRRLAGQGVRAARVVRQLGADTDVVAVDVKAFAKLWRAYQADPAVRYVEPDVLVETGLTPNDPNYWDLWGLQTIEAPSVWDRTLGAGITVAVLDTGIDETHPDLAGQIVGRQDFSGSAYGTTDTNGHGTHVAGTIAAQMNNSIGVVGLAPASRLLNGKVIGDSGSGSTSSAAAGIRWAADAGARVINMSLGSTGSCSPTFQDAIDYAWARDVVLVAAAMNNNSSSPTSPASCNHVMAVASSDQFDRRSSFSSYGTWVHVAAPGDMILSTRPSSSYGWMSGTSMASPHVAALAALVWSTGQFSTAQQVFDRIASTSVPIAGTGTSWLYGRVSASAAILPLYTSGTATPTASPASTATSTATSTASPPAMPTPTATAMPPSPTATVTVTATRTPAPTATASPTPTVTPPPPPTATATSTVPPASTASATPTDTAAPTPTVPVTPGPGATTWYFAEGYTGAGFDEYLTILNGNSAAADITLTYYLSSGAPIVRSVTVPADQRSTVLVHDDQQGVGRNQEVSVAVTASRPVVVERPMYFTYADGITDGHTAVGVSAPSPTWYFAGGDTRQDTRRGTRYDTYLTLLNPNPASASAQLTYYFERAAPVTRWVTVGGQQRKTVTVHAAAEGVGRGQSIGIAVQASQPLVVERPMYYRVNGTITGGSTTSGATALSPRWYFAEGDTRAGRDTALMLLNPHTTTTRVTLTYYLSSGAPVTRILTLPAQRRVTLNLASQVGTNRQFGIEVQAARPIVAERGAIFNFNGRTGGEHIVGAPQLAPAWDFAEGYTGAGFDEQLMLVNPATSPAVVIVTYYRSGQAPLARTYTVPARARATVPVNDAGQGVGPGQEVSMSVRADRPIVAERVMYFRYGQAVDGGHTALGFTSP